MDTHFQAVEAFPHQLQDLLAGSHQIEQEERVERLSQEAMNLLQETLNEFLAASETLRKMLEDIRHMLDERIKTPDELWRKRDFRLTETVPALRKPDLGMSEMRQVLESLNEAPKLLNSLDQIEQQRKTILLYDNEINELILTAWRKEHPDLSSMGILDTAIDISSGREVQSDTLKDLKTLDRR